MSNTSIGYRSPNRRHERRFFYKYTTAETAEVILATRKVRWSSPLLFNDRFDVTQELRLNFDEADLVKVLAEKLASLIEEGDSASVNHPDVAALLRLMSCLPPDAQRATAETLRLESGTASPGQLQAFDELKEHWRQVVRNLRVLCLSERNDVTSMWHRYADEYKGVVLEFEALDAIDSCFLVARQIVYQDSPPDIADLQVWALGMLGHTTLSFADLITRLLTKCQYVKTTDWSSEQEWRIVSSARQGETGDFIDRCYDPRELSGIYLGERCPAEQRAKLMALLAHGLEHVRVYEALPDNVKAKFKFRKIID